MADIRVEPNLEAVAAAAAEIAIEQLTRSLATTASANWMLAGGTAPTAAYDKLAATARHSLDWQHVYVALGDERFVPTVSPDATWPQIQSMLLTPLEIPEANWLQPSVLDTAEAMAEDYRRQLAAWVRPGSNAPDIDLLWIGVGEDGHTMSLFPDHSEATADATVVAVHNSPKPPPDRITLTLAALACTKSALILATGAGKADIIQQALSSDSGLPVAVAARAIEAAGGNVTWLLDSAAASKVFPLEVT